MSDYSWAIPVMRAGYAGRGLTYVAIAGLSLWAILRGGQAQGTTSAMETLSTSVWGIAILWLIAVGLLAYAVWRCIAAAADLEDHGTDAKAAIARLGMAVTGLIHGALGLVAIVTALGLTGGGGGIPGAVGWVLGLPGGRWIVGLAAIGTLGAGAYYLKKAWTADHRNNLKANHFTLNWDWALRAGVVAQGIIVLLIGGFLGAATINGNPNEAGGLAKVFDWLATRPFGNTLVIALCLGLLGFAFFCFVNAAYRIVAKASDDTLASLADRVQAELSR
ncbi:MAG: DUF1206 domain-containing protein [Jannaschia sp.]